VTIRIEEEGRTMGAVDFERAVLGAVLMNSETWRLVAVLCLNDFLLDWHRRIYARMTDLAESSRPIDMITLINELDCHKQLQVVGGVGYVSSLTEGLPDRPLDAVKHYVDEVRRFAALRRIAHAADSIREQAANDPGATIEGLRIRLSEVEREAARYEADLGARITRIEDIPDPFACPSDDIGWIA
jgi:replicative DNA helicase